MGLFGRDTARDAALHDVFARYAPTRGLEIRGAYPAFSLHGTHEGRAFGLHQWQAERAYDDDGARRTRLVWSCQASLRDPAWLGDLFVDEQHTLHRIVQFFGAQDHRVGWAPFDDAFTVKGSDEAAVRALLTPRACQALIDVWREGHPVRVINGALERPLDRMVEDPAVADGMLRALLHVASALGR